MSVEDAVMDLLAKRDGSVAYRFAWAHCGRATGNPLSRSAFEAALNALVRDEKIAPRQMGTERPIRLPPRPNPELPSEAQLMGPVGLWLRDVHLQSLASPAESFDRVLEDVHDRLPDVSGANTDFLAVLVSEKKTALDVRREIEVYAFELKNATANIQGAFQQVNMQKARVNYAYLIWHAPPGLINEQRVESVAEECRKTQIGMIVFQDADDHETYRVVVECPRNSISLEVSQSYVTGRLSDAGMRRLIGQEKAE